jgi:protein ImuB
VWLPDWPITRRFGSLRTAPPDTPFALVERTTRGLVVQAANRAARAIGVRLGQTHADARALCPGLESAAADPTEDRAGLERLALWCERFSPAVAVDQVGPRLDGLTLDVTGAAHLFGGEAALIAGIERRLRSAGVPCRAALADAPGAAWGLARFGPPEGRRVVPPGGGRDALAALPVEALRLAEPTLVLLKRFGLRRIGDLYALPRSGLARRFRGGEALEVVRRLDQALGLEAEALTPVRAAPVYRVWRNFAEPILIVEGVEHRLPELVGALSEQLDRDGQGARRLALTAFRVDGRTTAVEVGFSLPARAPAHLLRVLKDAGLERLDLGFGADALMLTAPAAEAVKARQGMLEGARPSPSQPSAGPLPLPGRGEGMSGRPERHLSPAGEREGPAPEGRGRVKSGAASLEPRDEDHTLLPALVDRLQAKLGPFAVRKPVPRERWLPERSEGLVRADAKVKAGRPADPARFRPLLLLDPPEPVEEVIALTPDYPPRRFTWRRLRHRVVKAQGPERIAPEWWRDGLPPPELEADRPVLKVAREDVEHIARQATARNQNSRKVSKPGVCVPALPNATGLEGRKPALTLVPDPEPSNETEGRLQCLQSLQSDSAAIPPGRTLDGYPPPKTEPFPLDGGRWPRGAGSDGGALPAISSDGGEDRNITPIRPASGGPPSPIQGEGRGDPQLQCLQSVSPPLPRTRDYFLVEDDEGCRFWLFRDGLQPAETDQPTWWLHGVAA